MKDYICFQNYIDALVGADGVVVSHVNFAPQILQARDRSFVLVTSGGDTQINEDARAALPPNITHWHAANVHVRDPRIHPIPIGIGSDPTYGNFSVIEEFQNTPKTRELFACFCLGNNPPERVPALNQAQIYDRRWTVKAFQQNENKLMPHRDFIREMAQHEFVLCPPGAQQSDTHRQWEALYLGCIPIVKRTVFNEVFQNLFPMVIVDDWSQVTPDRLKAWSSHMRPVRGWQDRLKLSWWVERIKASVPQEQPA